MAAGVQTVGRSGTGSNKQAVDGRDACDELTVLRRTVALPVVVAPRKIPHEVAQIHVGELVRAVEL